MNSITTYKLQLELMAGGETDGQVQLGALPQVTDDQLAAMDLEADLAAAEEASYDLYEAKLTLDDAKETYSDAGGDGYHNKDNYEWQAANHQWKSAQYTYDAAVQNFEAAFRALYLQVKDCKQVLDAAGTALAVKQSDYAVAQLKQEQGASPRTSCWRPGTPWPRPRTRWTPPGTTCFPPITPTATLR